MAYELRPYQEQAVRDLRLSISEGNKAVVLVVPTGGGKTIISAEMISGAVKKGKHVLFLAPRRTLVYQTAEKLDGFDVNYGILMAGEEKSLMPTVQVASIPTMYRRFFENGEIKKYRGFQVPLPKADLIIIDEAHASMSEMVSTILSAYPNAVIIGLTATPARSDGRGLGAIYKSMVLGPSIAELTEMGNLVPVRYYGGTEADLSKVKITAGEYVEKQLYEAVNTPKLVGDVVDNYKRICPDRLAVVFAVNRKHAMALHDEFNAHGIKAAYIDGETPNEERHAIFADIEAGITRVLCSVEVVSMGWDCPPVSCAIIARPTKSIARYLQMVGRVLRPYPGKTDSIVIDHSGVVRDLGFIDEHQPWSLDGNETIQERKEKLSKPELKDMACPTCKAIIAPGPSCPACGKDLRQAYSKAIEALKADLIEIKPKPKKLDGEQKLKLYGELKQYCRDNGKAPGYAAHLYKSKTGVWPNKYKDAPFRTPSAETLNYIKSRNIAYAKRKTA